MASWAQVASRRAEDEEQPERRRPTAGHDYFRVSGSRRSEYGKSYQDQEYGPHVGAGVDTEPTGAELQQLPRACARLWGLDTNRLTPGEDFEINVQGGKDFYDRGDMADNSLFSRVDNACFHKPTFSRYYVLLDNYSAEQNREERETGEERQEQRAFVEEVFRTAPVQYVYKYLVKKGHVSEDTKNFKSLVHDLWFSLYDRGGADLSSSAFEHVFVGEVKNRGGRKEVSGFHNWIHFYSEESKGHIDYKGLVLPRRRRREAPDSHSQLLTIQFEWDGVLKQNSSIFVGTSPEFELALYTLCFFEGEEDNFLELGGHHVNVKVYRMGRDKLASAFTTVND